MAAVSPQARPDVTASALIDHRAASAARVAVRERMPVLPRVAFVLITLAALAGTALTNRGLGIGLEWLVPRWLALWGAAGALGLLAWRLWYLDGLRRTGTVAPDPSRTAGLARARAVGRWLAAPVALTIPAAMWLTHLEAPVGTRPGLLAAAAILTIALLVGIDRGRVATVGLAAAIALAALWAVGDAGTGAGGLLRGLHLAAFGLWLGGALWNLTVAVPVGMRHPTVAAVVSGAHQLQRFRRVARVCLPTIVITGALMAVPRLDGLGALATTASGRLIAAKIGLIVLLVVIFITCPLYRQCSPVAGVCEAGDLGSGDDGSRP